MADPKIIFIHKNNLFTIDGKTKKPLLAGHDNYYEEIAGSCNGLLLLRGNRDEDSYTGCLSLVNPKTGEIKKLPLVCETECRYSHHLYGLGYSKKTKDYKVVQMCYNDTAYHHPTCYLLSLKKNVWEERFDFPIEFLGAGYEPSGGVNFNGFAHWISNPTDLDDYGFSSLKIMYFDFDEDKFNFLQCPSKGDNDDIVEYEERSYQLGVVRDCLSLIERLKGGGYRIWMMKEYGDKNSWTKLSLKYNKRISSVSRFTVNDELLVRLEVHLMLGEVELGLYNFKRKSVKKLGVSRSDVVGGDGGEEWLYVENSSLLLTNETEKQIRKRKRSREEATTTSNATQDNSEEEALTLVSSKKRASSKVTVKARQNREKSGFF